MRIYTLSIPGKDSQAFDSVLEMLDALDGELVLGECPRQLIVQIDVHEMRVSEFRALGEPAAVVLHLASMPNVTHCEVCGAQVRGIPDGRVHHLVETYERWRQPPRGFKRCKEG